MARQFSGLVACILVFTCSACFETRGSAWMKTPLDGDDSYRRSTSVSRGQSLSRPTQSRAIGDTVPKDADESSAPTASASGQSLGIFRNTYYCFPRESDYSGARAQVFNRQCQAIATVPQTFLEKVCVQGSGTLANGQTISFAKRDCECASICPRTGQRICYDALDAREYPWGRGATGRAITPFRTVAVDTKIIALGTRLFIPAYAGIRTSEGVMHDGCFVAEDRGIAVSGNSVDIFTGSESATREWNQQVHTGTGVEIFKNDPRCR